MPQEAKPLAPLKDEVVLIHGLMRTPLSMYSLKTYLQRQGLNVELYGYISARYTIHEHAQAFKKYIEHLIYKNPHYKIHIVGHSLGGIIAREALAGLTAQEMKHIHSLIMLAPPNKGSRLALWSTRVPGLSATIKPLAELSSDDSSYVHKIPIPKVKIGIIAGKFDAKVPPEYTRLQGQAEPVVVNSTHTFIMNNPVVKRLVYSFIKKGQFS
ncbi:MAG: hypothetical protein BGO90_12625 [Legionella sp. 40-6]|nr:alpha/beta fold hydrolase [Legionella sp.]OJY36144.1 MAG: hypothetical protein BGO90_12625 [Legionella sp. 40-6]